MILGLVSQLILKKNASFDVKGGGAEQQSLKFSRDWHNWTFLHIQLGSRRVRQNDPWLPEIVYIYGFQSISLQHQLYLDTQISLNNEGGKHQLGFISKQQLTLFFFTADCNVCSYHSCNYKILLHQSIKWEFC